MDRISFIDSSGDVHEPSTLEAVWNNVAMSVHTQDLVWTYVFISRGRHRGGELLGHMLMFPDGVLVVFPVGEGGACTERRCRGGEEGIVEKQHFWAAWRPGKLPHL